MRGHVQLCNLNRGTEVDGGRGASRGRDIVGAAGQAFAISSLQILSRLRLEDSPVQHEGMAHAGCGDGGKGKMRSGCEYEYSQNKEPAILMKMKQARRRAR